MPANNKKKIANYLKDSDAAKYVEAIETNSKLDELVKTLKNVNDPAAELPGDLAGKDNIVFVFKGPAGPKGEDGKDGVGKDGKTPIKYVDYFTDDEIKQIIDFATPIKGEDYFTDKDKKQLYKEFEKSIDLSKLRGPKGEDGKPGEKGADGSPDTGLEISNKLNELKGVLDWSVLKNIPVSFGKKEAGTIGKFSRGVSTFKALTDVPQTYVGQANKVVSVKADESGLEFTAAGGGGSSQWTTSGSDIYYDTGAVFIGMSTDDGGALQIKPDATDDIIRGFSNAGTVQFVIQGNGNIISTPLASGGTSPTMSGTTVMVVTDSNGRFGFETKPVGFTTELAQDAVGAMVDASLTYVDATPLLQRAALTGAITASAGSNTTSLGSFTAAQLNTAVSDADVATLAGAESLTNKKLGSLTTNGFVKTSGGDGSLSVDTTTYQTQDATLTALAGITTAADKMIQITGSDTFTTQDFKIVSEATYTGTITWTGTTAPSGTEDFTYRWIRVGNMVTLNISLIYGTAGTALTLVKMTLPSDCPTPDEPAGATAADTSMYPVTGFIITNPTGSPAASRAWLRVNASDNGYDINVAAGSTNARVVQVTAIYWTS